MNDIKHAKTKEILECFEQISKIPRCSKNEKEIAEWLLNWAKEHNFETRMDKVRNIVIKIPGSAGYEKSPVVVVQGHMDMVCEKTPDSPHDFCKDPIKFVYKDEWLTADRTTLGADNGIAIAMAMVLATDKSISHPPLELLFTVDEETGLTGANNLAAGFIEGKILINVDSEDEGVFTVGCAGGINTNLKLPIEYEAIPAGYKQYKITAGGMKGGHSGIDISKGKANALRILGRSLYQLKKQNIDLRLADVKGGSAHNAIPRDASAVVFLPEGDAAKAKDTISEWSKTFNCEFKATDPDLAVSIAENSEANFTKVITAPKTQKIIEFMLVIPHGVEAMSQDIEGLVETSNNFANLKVENDVVKILTSQRSSVISRLHALTERIESTAYLAGGEAQSGDGYPPWQPNMESPLLERSKKLYEKMYNKKPVVEVIHAGLECGIIGDRNPGMDMISIGPTLKFPHSPDEKINVPSIGKVWDFIIELLKELK
ncbi:MAG TPA: aminoacyl-histidine dipeptidase [Candidatus Kapabacteria bacterium]|nr:aminoacyl-histidine dipeptidase [Candidatus Kapabacteria bacterium]